MGVKIVQKTKEIIDYFKVINPNLKWFIENPLGKLRKLPVMDGLPRATITYCSYGDMRMKPTDIWSNFIYDKMFNVNGWVPLPRCMPSTLTCHHEKAPRGSKTGTQGLKGAYLRSKIPERLCEDIIKSLLA